VGWFFLYYVVLSIPSVVTEATRSRFGSDVVYIHDDYPTSISADTPQFAIYGLNKLDGYPDQVFIVGGSAARAFKPRDIMKELPGYKVHNLCVDGANATEIKQSSDLIESRVDLRRLHSAVFVVSGQFPTFLDNEREYHADLTNIDQEKLRFYLYRLDKGHVIPVFTGPLMTAAAFLVRPFMWMYTLKFNISNGVEEAREWLDDLSQHQREKERASKAEYYNAYRLSQYQNRGLTDDQFNDLRDMIHRLIALNAVVIYVDLPVPGFVRKNQFLYDDYRQRVKVITGDPAVHHLDLGSWAPDDQFIDDSHTEPEFSDRLSAELARYLKTVIRQSAQGRSH
jgi:hypothetical protein